VREIAANGSKYSWSKQIIEHEKAQKEKAANEAKAQGSS